MEFLKKLVVVVGMAAASLICAAGPAHAESASLVVSIAAKADGSLFCKAETDGTDQVNKTGAATVKVNPPTGATLKTYEVKSGAKLKPAGAFDGAGVAAVEDVTAGKAFELEVVTTKAGADTHTVCQLTISPPKQTPPPVKFDPKVDVRALEYWKQEGIETLRQLRAAGEPSGLPHSTQFLVHLPSGAAAFPFPNSVAEGTPLQVVVLVPANQQEVVTLAVTSCADVQNVRIKPTDSSGQQADENRIIAVPIGSWFKCGAGTANYTLTYGDGDTARISATA